jgi:hypothetical protein
VPKLLNCFLVSETLAHSAGRVWYTCEPACRLTRAERFPARFPSLGLHGFWFRLRSVLAGSVPLSKLVYNVSLQREQAEAPNHFIYSTPQGGNAFSSTR